MNRTAITVAYVFPALLMLLVFVVSWLQGDPGTAIFQKMLVAPLFLLAIKGLRTYFPEHLDSERSLATSLEFSLLNGAIVAAFIVLVTMRSESDLLTQIGFFLGMTLLLGLSDTLFLWLRRRRISRK